MKKNTFLWLAFVFIFLFLPPSRLLEAETMPGSAEGENTYHLILLICTGLTAICLLTIFLVAYFRKE
jgi:hypothetical protein